MNAVTDYLRALREDLRDRRLLPLVVLAGVAMVGAIAFVVLGGSGGSSTPTTASTGAATPSGAAESSSLPLSHDDTSNAVAETTVGTSVQHGGGSRNPFVVLPNVAAAEAAAEAKAKTSTSESSSGSSSGGSSSSEPPSSSSGSSGSGGSSSEGSSKSGGSSGGKSGGSKSKPSEPKTVYDVSVLFGEVTPGTSGQGAGLTPYESLKLYTPLPSQEEPLVVYRGVSNKGRTATFTVATETILQGPGKCLPSAFECKAIQLQEGQNEQLQYLKPGTQNVQSYELRLVSITSSNASKASVASIVNAQSRAGMEVLRRANLVAIPGLGMSSLAGVLVPTS
ncbi:MAG TPA: hypothetical protein VMB91_11115 [Solirubrobacteraceae bacterium]|nr:hypothetical protein [Solirubrobacteraceae bacterium]